MTSQNHERVNLVLEAAKGGFLVETNKTRLFEFLGDFGLAPHGAKAVNIQGGARESMSLHCPAADQQQGNIPTLLDSQQQVKDFAHGVTMQLLPAETSALTGIARERRFQPGMI